MSQESKLKTEVISGIKWSGFARGSQQVLQVFISVILARLLMPEDFGVLAMAMVFTGLIAVFNDFGIGSAIIQKQDLTDDDLSSIFWFNVCIGLLVTLFTIAISPFIASFYQKDVLKPLISLMALGFFFSAFSTVHQSLLIKEMNLKKIAIFEIISTAVGGIIAISLAFRGYGVWSLAWQGLSATIIMVSLFWITSKWRPKFRFYTKSIRSIMGFSLNLLGFSTVNYFSRNVDYLLIGKFLGAESLGYYTLAYRLMLYPLQNISRVISKVLFPALSRIQKDDKRFQNAYLRSTKFIAFVSFPIMFGLFAVADEFILTLFGQKWEPAIFLIKVLCFVGMVQSIGATVGQIYLAKGRTNLMFKWGLLSTALIVLSVSIGLFWGLKGVVVAYALIAFILIYPNFAIPFRLIGLKVQALFHYLRAEFVTSLMMFLMVFISVTFSRFLLADPMVILVINVFFGIIMYILIAKKFNPEAFDEIREMIFKKERV